MILQADSRHIPLADQSINCIITSPPYWSLRKYDIPDLIWDGIEGCEHKWIADPVPGDKSGKPGPNACVGMQYGDTVRRREPTNTCGRCSAWRGQLGLEPTIDLYLKHLLQIMDECKRVLRDDGTMWVNIGDSYAGGKGSSSGYYREEEDEDRPTLQKKQHYLGAKGYTRPCDGKIGIPSKSLCLIPYRFAIEMVNRGWILRNIIQWHKPNCMPSSAKDRFTVDFEPIFFFVKNKKYWFEQQFDKGAGNKWGKYSNPKYGEGTGGTMQSAKELTKEEYIEKYQQKNRRCVWTIPTQPYPESHFATFPEDLVEPMIKSGCPQFVCIKCGKAREKIIEYKGGTIGKSWHNHSADKEKGMMQSRPGLNLQENKDGEKYQRIDQGYTDCGCNAGFKPGIVLDPFCGSGTVIKVAEKFQRKGIGIDLGYQELQGRRILNNQKALFV